MERESTLKQVWGSLTQNKGAMAGLVIIVVLAVIAVIGDTIAPYDPELSDMTSCFVAPCAEHIFPAHSAYRGQVHRHPGSPSLYL